MIGLRCACGCALRQFTGIQGGGNLMALPRCLLTTNQWQHQNNLLGAWSWPSKALRAGNIESLGSTTGMCAPM